MWLVALILILAGSVMIGRYAAKSPNTTDGMFILLGHAFTILGFIAMAAA